MSSLSLLKKIGEDNRLRPFLSSLFDAESYVKNVIKEGRSEECFDTIVACIEDINVEIKGYISMHKDNLMSGMQDVATLAERYEILSASSQKLSNTIRKMKREALESHALVSTKTLELERIHETSVILHQLKQFASAKAQLDSFLSDTNDTDMRNLSSAAKTLSELEKLLLNPKLLEIKFVANYVDTVKQFGKTLRLMAQERLLSAITEKNQASIASSLQVFFNLESLKEIVLMIVDNTLKATVDVSRDTLDFELLSGIYTDSHNTVAAPASATKRPPPSTSTTAPSQISIAQQRIAIRELAHQWSVAVHEKATQIHVFQRVVAKKEDPATHVKFIDVLRSSSQSPNPSSSDSVPVNISHQYLANGQLLELFWFRLSVALHDISADKLRTHALTASRAYPYLRKSAAEVVNNLHHWTEKDTLRDITSNNGFLTMNSPIMDLASAGGRDTHSLFGSLQWSQDDLLDCGTGFGRVSTRRYNNSSAATGGMEGNVNDHHEYSRQKGIAASQSIGRGTSNNSSDEDCHLVSGLKPMHNRYLVSTLKRMTVPIEQMFPDVDGYSAAVPSKRDLQTLIKAVQAEFLTVAIESDAGLLRVVCKEFQKAVKMMLTKVEGMVSNTVDTRKISSQNNFARTSQQEHNGQLLSLLMQFKDALEKIPGSVAKQYNVESGSGDVGAASTELNHIDEMVVEMTKAVAEAVGHIEELASRQILDSVVALLSGYTRSLLLGMHKEGVVSVVGGGSASSSALRDDTLECSSSMQLLIKQMPLMMKSHILSLVRCAVVDNAVEEICLRTMHAFVSIAAVLRPVNEMTRLRTAKDMTALEMLVSGICTIQNQDQCPIVQEFRSFRRLLFLEDEKGHATKQKSNNMVNAPPNRTHLFRQDYVSFIRPSTMLGYYVSCGPTQLLSPYDVTPDFGLQTYIEELVHIADNDSQHSSVRSLFVDASAERDDWRSISNEKRSWEIIQQCLDNFFQRIAVAEGGQKLTMRAWYEAILDIGSHYYGNH